VEESRLSHVKWIASAVLLFQPIAADIAWAKCPEPKYSYLAPCLIACPAGDSVFVTLPRDWAQNPEGGEEITLDFSNCPGFRLSPLSGGEPYTIDSTGRQISVLTDAFGYARFPVRGGGVHGGGLAVLRGCTHAFGTRSVASPDQDGDLIVDDADVALIESKLGTSDSTAELDCDGLVTAADVEIARAHLGHRAAALVSVLPPIDSELSLAAYPNPVAGPLTVSFSLPSAVPVTLELLDLSGRRVQRQELGVLGPGLHTHALALERKLPGGVYFLRLSQPRRHIMTRICVLP
jgi:hypothetical protein